MLTPTRPRSSAARPPHRLVTHGLAIGLALALTATLAACSGGSSDAGSGGSGESGSKVSCGTDTLAAASKTKPVDIVFWHTMVRTNNDWLVKSIKAFNASQKQVHVTLRQQPDYPTLFTRYKAGLSSGDLPDLAQFEETTVTQLMDSKSTVPVQSCIDETDYALDDYLPRALAYYNVDGTQQSMPWSVSNPILFYNPSLFTKAGLDPEKPPTTLAEVKEYAQKIVDSKAAKYGIALQVKAYVYEFLLAKSGGLYVNNSNGRSKRATEANLDSDISRKIWSWWDDMVKSKLALNTGGGENDIDHLLAVGTGDAAMVIEASGAIGPAEAVLASGQYKGVTLRTSELPSLQGGGGVPVGDGSLWISSKSAPEKRAAAWKLIEWLDSPEQQAGLANAGGYVPIRTSAVELPEVQKKWAADPNYRTAYDQLTSGKVTDANVGSLIGDYQAVRDQVRDGITRMLSQGQSVDAATASAAKTASAAMQDYNERAGG